MPSANCFFCHSNSLTLHSYNRTYCSNCKKRYSSVKTERIAKIIEYFCLELPAQRTSLILNLDYKTVYKTYKQLRMMIAKNSISGLLCKIPQLTDEPMLVNISLSYQTSLGLAIAIVDRLHYPVFFDPHYRKQLEALLVKHADAYHVIIDNDRLSLKKLLKSASFDRFNFWSSAKKGLHKFNGVSKKRLSEYIFEHAWRLNNKNSNLHELLLDPMIYKVN